MANHALTKHIKVSGEDAHQRYVSESYDNEISLSQGKQKVRENRHSCCLADAKIETR